MKILRLTLKKKVKLINVGRNNINMTVDVKNSDAMRREISKYILSRIENVELIDE